MIIEQCKQDHFKLLQYSKAKFDLLLLLAWLYTYSAIFQVHSGSSTVFILA